MSAGGSNVMTSALRHHSSSSRFNIIPADFAAAAIVHISKQVMTNNESSLRHHCFHLANLESVSVSDVAEALRAKGVHLHTTK